MQHLLSQEAFAGIVEGICAGDRELRLELERQKRWDVYRDALATAYQRYTGLGLGIREAFGLTESSVSHWR
jgi:hypothetical protein